MISTSTKHYMSIVQETAQLSNDWHTKVGAVFVKDGSVLSTGYNAGPIGLDETLIPTENGKTLLEQKNTYMVHAELNAVIGYNGNIADLRGSTLYINICPCSQCAKMLIQLGVKNVVYLEDYHRMEETNAAKFLFKACKIPCEKYIEGETE